MLQFFGGLNPYFLAAIGSVILFSAAIILFRYFNLRSAREKDYNDPTEEDLYELISDAGYSYDPEQDIFYSKLDSWQRNMGYCRLYDEACAPFSMIVDCEPIFFEYGGKRWMIEFWKGQYGMTTGGEVGVYTTEGTDLDIPDFFTGTFYNCARDEDCLYMSFTLEKNGKVLFTRSDRHWWVTGFKLGEFAEPWELSMYLTIALKDAEMRDAFLEGLIKAGYSENEILIVENIVGLLFDKPRTPQPASRMKGTDWLIQRKNEFLCDRYMEITEPYEKFPDKMRAIRKMAPELYNMVLNLGRSKQLFAAFEKIKDYLS